MIRFKKPNKRLLTIAIVMLTLGFAGMGIGVYQATSSQAEGVHSTPNFAALVPKGKTIDQLGGWQKLTTPNGDAFYVFVDSTNAVTVNVSQQKLPGKFKNNLSNEMQDMARAYNATVKLDVDGTTVYIGTSAKGPQSVLFAKKDALVLIKSWATIKNSDWVTYIRSLE